MTPPGPGSVEHEIKLGAFPGFAMPDLAAAVAGLVVEEEPALDLVATYVDTPDLQLVRNGASLRRRTGEGATRWTLKLPKGRQGGGLLRREIDVEDDGEEVPASLASLVTGWVRGTALGPVVVIASHRRRLRLRDPHGAALAEVDDDEVSVVDGGDVVARFREVEVELAEAGTPELLGEVAGALEAAGAGAPDPTSKVARALGPRALVPPDLAPAELDGTATVEEVVAAALRAAVGSLVAHDHVVRLDDDVEGVHQARVATRRLRSDLGTLRPVLVEGWAEGLRSELAGLAVALGRVRDTDVLHERLTRTAASLSPPDQVAAARAVAEVASGRRGELDELLALMGADGYVALLDDLVAAASAPRLRSGGDRPALDVLPGLVRPRWRRLHQAVDQLGAEPDDGALHRVRLLAKQARYAAELAAPVVGLEAAALASALAQLQDVLGELHDTVVAEARLREVRPRLSPSTAFAAGQLAVLVRADGDALRARWRESWAACDRTKLTRWTR